MAKRSITLNALVAALLVVAGAVFISGSRRTGQNGSVPPGDDEQVTGGQALAALRSSSRDNSVEKEVNREGIRERLEGDVRAGRPLVAHLVVALCDNKHQGIVPVPAPLGNGQDPGNNLYWGAMYGFRTFLTKNTGWKVVRKCSNLPAGVLDKIVLHAAIGRGEKQVDVYLAAEAWDGKQIKPAVERFLRMAGGREGENLNIGTEDKPKGIQAGGAAHLIAYVGHNGLMDFSLAGEPNGSASAVPRSAIVLACKSKPYFLEHLKKACAHPLLLTTGFMAPEAYTLDGALRAWAGGQESEQVRERAAAAYDKYQKCGLKAARNLFYFEPYPEKK